MKQRPVPLNGAGLFHSMLENLHIPVTIAILGCGLG